jgi:hypothetical protein
MYTRRVKKKQMKGKKKGRMETPCLAESLAKDSAQLFREGTTL